MTESIKNTDTNESEIISHEELGEASLVQENIIHNEQEAINAVNAAIESNEISESDKENLIEIKNNIEQLQSDFSPEKKEENSEISKKEETGTVIKQGEVKPENPVVKKDEKELTKGGGGSGGFLGGLKKVGGFFGKGFNFILSVLGISVAVGASAFGEARKLHDLDEKKK